MARNRQRAKQRQAERRAQRLGKDGDGRERPAPDPALDEPRVDDPTPEIEDPRAAEPAPIEELLRTDEILPGVPQSGRDTEAELHSEAEALREIEDWEVEGDRPGDAETTERDFSPRGRRGEEDDGAKHRSRVVQFLIAVWAELQRVQWPNRQALTTLTGVVLGFVLIAGGYLGLLDAIFSRLIQAIL